MPSSRDKNTNKYILDKDTMFKGPGGPTAPNGQDLKLNKMCANKLSAMTFPKVYPKDFS